MVKLTMLVLIFKGPHLSSQQGLLALELSADFSQRFTSYPQAATQVTEEPHFRAPSFLKYDVAQRKKKILSKHIFYMTLHRLFLPLPLGCFSLLLAIIFFSRLTPTLYLAHSTETVSQKTAD